jgi:pilus assembly protein Flp/PilA
MSKRHYLPLRHRLSRHKVPIKQTLTIQSIEDARCRSGMLLASATRVVCQQAEEAITMVQLFKDFLADETAATAIEYGLIAAGISLAIIAVVNGIGSKLNTKFSSINASLK